MDITDKLTLSIILIFVIFILCLSVIDTYETGIKEETKRACLHQAEIMPTCKELLGIKK